MQAHKGTTATVDAIDIGAPVDKDLTCFEDV